MTVITTGHVLAAAMNVLQMTTLEDSPPADIIPIWTANIEERREFLERVSLRILDKFVDFRFQTNQVDHGAPQDQVLCYASEVLSLGLFFQEYSDSIREGDGNRVLRCWRYLLPLFITSHRTNYSLEAFNLLYQYHFVLSPRQAQQLIWDRFVNTHGRPGQNIPCDLHLEHLNRLVKVAIRSEGSNQTEKCITRVSKAIGTLKPVLDCFDANNCIAGPSGSHNISAVTRDCNLLVKELTTHAHTFDRVEQRKHRTFTSIKGSLLQEVSYTKLVDWIGNHVPHTTPL